MSSNNPASDFLSQCSTATSADIATTTTTTTTITTTATATTAATTTTTATTSSPVRIPSLHVCPYGNCGKSFSKKYNLKAHLRLHTGELPFECDRPDCNKKFKWRSSLSSHAVWHTRKDKSSAVNPSDRLKSTTVSLTPITTLHDIKHKSALPASNTPRSSKSHMAERLPGGSVDPDTLPLSQPRLGNSCSTNNLNSKRTTLKLKATKNGRVLAMANSDPSASSMSLTVTNVPGLKHKRPRSVAEQASLQPPPYTVSKLSQSIVDARKENSDTTRITPLCSPVSPKITSAVRSCRPPKRRKKNTASKGNSIKSECGFADDGGNGVAVDKCGSATTTPDGKACLSTATPPVKESELEEVSRHCARVEDSWLDDATMVLMEDAQSNLPTLCLANSPGSPVTSNDTTRQECNDETDLFNLGMLPTLFSRSHNNLFELEPDDVDVIGAPDAEEGLFGTFANLDCRVDEFYFGLPLPEG